MDELQKESTPAPDRGEPAETEISWQAPESEHHERGPLWHLSSIVVAVLLVAISLWQQNFLFAIFVVIAWLVIYFSLDREPTIFSFTAGVRGLSVGPRRYPWPDFSSFSVTVGRSENLSHIHLYPSHSFSLSLVISVPNEQFAKIKNIFHNYLPEVEHEDTIFDTLIHLLRL